MHCSNNAALTIHVTCTIVPLYHCTIVPLYVLYQAYFCNCQGEMGNFRIDIPPINDANFIFRLKVLFLWLGIDRRWLSIFCWSFPSCISKRLDLTIVVIITIANLPILVFLVFLYKFHV